MCGKVVLTLWVFGVQPGHLQQVTIFARHSMRRRPQLWTVTGVEEEAAGEEHPETHYIWLQNKADIVHIYKQLE